MGNVHSTVFIKEIYKTIHDKLTLSRVGSMVRTKQRAQNEKKERSLTDILTSDEKMTSSAIELINIT